MAFKNTGLTINEIKKIQSVVKLYIFYKLIL